MTRISREAGSIPACAVALCGLLGLLPVQAHAESAPDEWQWGATLYLWLPSLGGETSFPTDGGAPPIEISTDALLDSINMAFMGALEARKGRWGAAADVIYLDLGASQKGSRDFSIGSVELPASVSADLKADLTGWLWTLTGSYNVIPQENFSLDLLAGARLLDLQEDLRWTFNGDISSLPLPGRSGSSHSEDSYWDAIVGVKGRATFGASRNWFVPYYLDIGAGESDLTLQARLGLGYSFESLEVLGVWRYLDYDLGESRPIKSIDFNGPALGVTFRF
ncbi:MAG: hypothetical protein IT483_10430 [Gammaproteobacteria bacterium]|nr:hypothetical protein [Gammaproteobacteria bacterium]